jgi:hypothetical protein
MNESVLTKILKIIKNFSVTTTHLRKLFNNISKTRIDRELLKENL